MAWAEKYFMSTKYKKSPAFILTLFLAFAAHATPDSGEDPVEKLKCNTPEASSEEIKASEDSAKTEAGTCPDCEALQKSSVAGALAVPRLLRAADTATAQADYAKVAAYIDTENTMFPAFALTNSPGDNYYVLEELEIEQGCVEKKWPKKINLKSFLKVLINLKIDIVRFDIILNPEDRTKIFAFNPKSLPNTKEFDFFCKIKSVNAAGYPKDGNYGAVFMEHYAHRKDAAEKGIKAFEETYAKLNFYKPPPYPKKPTEAGADKCGINPEEFGILKMYTRTLYHCLNTAMRGEDDCRLGDRLPAMVRSINRALAKIAPYKGVVYRGVKFIPDELSKLHQVGATIEFSSYLSSSKNKVVAQGFGRSIYVINSKSGREISPIGVHIEQEVLFPPKTKFKIAKIESEAADVKLYYLDEL
jgi:hypothetical protein